jgi:transposase
MRHDESVPFIKKQEETKMKITTIGLDIAKNVFHLVGCDVHGKQGLKKKLRRNQVLRYFAQLSPCLVGIEACASAHYWARELAKLGHKACLIAPQHVKPYVQGNKNDYNDAAGIAEAVTRPKIRFVSVKSEEQQDIQAMHRLRESQVGVRTKLCNQLRGLLGEYGIVIPKGVNVVSKRIPEILEDSENGLSSLFRELLWESYQHLLSLNEHIDYYNQKIKMYSQQNEACKRLQSIPGFGPVVASVFLSYVGDGQNYSRGRDVSASLGLVPRQHSSGGKNVLLGISKRGDRYLRSLLIHGARSVVRQAADKGDRLSRWINRIRAERGYNKAAVALANKMARMGWAVLRNKTVYQLA